MTIFRMAVVRHFEFSMFDILWHFIIIIIIMKAKIIVTLYIKNVTGALYTVITTKTRCQCQ